MKKKITIMLIMMMMMIMINYDDEIEKKKLGCGGVDLRSTDRGKGQKKNVNMDFSRKM